jgi:hypothetical protein
MLSLIFDIRVAASCNFEPAVSRHAGFKVVGCANLSVTPLDGCQVAVVNFIEVVLVALCSFEQLYPAVQYKFPCVSTTIPQYR